MIPPDEAIFIWNLYWSKFRATGVTFSEIKNYNELYGYELTNWEIEMLFTLHNTVEGTIGEILEKRRKKK